MVSTTFAALWGLEKGERHIGLAKCFHYRVTSSPKGLEAQQMRHHVTIVPGKFSQVSYQSLQRVATVFTALLALGSVIRLTRIGIGGGNSWITADWLIRYADGYVRRGLIGELVWGISNMLQLNPLLVVTSLQIMFFSAFVIFSCLLFVRSSQTLTTVMLFISPAFIAFHFWDLQGGFRKEIVLLATLSYLLWQSTQGVAHTYQKHLLLVGWAGSPMLFTFVHEGLVFFSPLFLVALWSVRKRVGVSEKSFWTTSAIAAALSCIPFALSFVFPGSQLQAQIICGELVQIGLGESICGGAIASMGWSLQEAVTLAGDHATPIFALLGALSLAPFLLSKPKGRYAIIISCASLSVVPLFVVGADWGRWIHISVSILTLIHFTRNDADDPQNPPRIAPSIAMLVSAAYALSWHLPHFGASYWGPGLLEMWIQVLAAFGSS